MNRDVKLILVLWVALPALINGRQVDEPSNFKEEVTWELRNYNGTIVVGSGAPPKLWVRAFPQVQRKKVLPSLLQSYYIIFLHLILKKTCTHFIYTYLLGAS